MPIRDERRAEAVKHLALMKGAFAKETQATIDAAVVYEDGDALDSSAKAVLPIKGSSANASSAAIAIFNRFMVWPPSCFPPYAPIA